MKYHIEVEVEASCEASIDTSSSDFGSENESSDDGEWESKSNDYSSKLGDNLESLNSEQEPDVTLRPTVSPVKLGQGCVGVQGVISGYIYQEYPIFTYHMKDYVILNNFYVQNFFIEGMMKELFRNYNDHSL